MKDADAVLILADRHAENPDLEDAANITRATAIKNFHPQSRIIAQILHQKNKVIVTINIPFNCLLIYKRYRKIGSVRMSRDFWRMCTRKWFARTASERKHVT